MTTRANNKGSSWKAIALVIVAMMGGCQANASGRVIRAGAVIAISKES